SPSQAVSKISAARKHFSARAGLPKNPLSRTVKIGRELMNGNYTSFSNGFRSALKDLWG
ncbi:MAG: hypothetical protein H7Z37_09315, partial [Pyrinomonadaceae bacterium]|nr:hypothetical protein [Pyrinomonadaceae bacterium]